MTNNIIKEIKDKDGKVLALFFPKEIDAGGAINFLTPQNYPLQIGLIEHNDGKQVKPHIHRDLVYNVNTTQEFILVERGNGLKVSIYSNSWDERHKLAMSAGDAILFVSGGHSLDIPPGCRLWEIKQGPYPGDKVAKIFKE